jgi:hypothetical protein
MRTGHLESPRRHGPLVHCLCRRHGWLAEDAAGGFDRRREPADRTRAIPRAELERLWRREDASVRVVQYSRADIVCAVVLDFLARHDAAARKE